MMRGRLSTVWGRMRPYAATTSRSGSKDESSARNSRVLIRTGLSAGIPCRDATAPTSLGESAIPRPRGSSGRVTTATTRKRGSAAVMIRSRIWAASAGVPMKTIFSGVAIALDADRGGTLVGLALLDQFLELASIKFALDAADSIDEQLAFQMVDLVLQRDRQKIVGFNLDLLLLRRPCAHQHLGRALNLGGIVDHGQASFFPDDLSLRLDDLRIDQLEQMFARFVMVGIEHDDAF